MTDVLVDGREVVIRLRVRRLVCPQTLRIAPAYRPTLVDPYRGHFRERRQADPAAPVLHLFREIKEHGYTGGLNLLHRYHNQGRMKATAPSPLRATPAASCSPTPKPAPGGNDLLEKIATACPEMTALANLLRGFAALLKPAEGNDVKLTEWIMAACAVDLRHLRSLTNGLEIDRPATDAGLTLP